MSMFSTEGVRVEARRGSGARGDELRREAEILARARHPGIADLVDVRTDGAATEVRTAVPEGAPLASVALTVEEVAGVVAVVATTVADLHDIGVAHGAICAETVVIGDDGRVVLIDFARAALLDGPTPKWPSHRLARRDDRALGELLAALLTACTSPSPVHPASLESPDDASHWPRLALGRRQHRTLAPIAAVRRLGIDAASGTVSSRRLAEALATEVPGARLPRRPPVTETSDTASGRDGDFMSDEALERWFATPPRAADERPDDASGAPTAPTRARQATPVALGGALAVVLVIAAYALTAPTGAPRTTSTHVGSGCVPVSSPCAAYQAGALTIAGHRYAVGTQGDVAAIGRWSCSSATLALLQPASGDVWMYPEWPTATAAVTPVLVGSVPGARALGVGSRHGCDTLFATLADGRRVSLPAPPKR